MFVVRCGNVVVEARKTGKPTNSNWKSQKQFPDAWCGPPRAAATPHAGTVSHALQTDSKCPIMQNLNYQHNLFFS